MRSLIIGGSGFVGTYLERHLRTLGHETHITKMPKERVGRNETGRYEQDIAAAVWDLDILDAKAVSRLIERIQPDYIFHLAAQSSVVVSWERPGLTADINIRGSIHVLEAVRRQKKKMRVLLIGWGEEYGKISQEEVPVCEECRVRPGNIYAATKVCQNMIGAIYAQAYGMDVLMVRAFNHIGPKQSPIFVLSDFCRQTAEIEAGKKEAVIKTGNLDAKRDFTDVRDVVRAYALLTEKGKAGETYNIGSGHAVRVGDILQMILEQSKVKFRIETDPKKFRPLDVPVIEADIRKVCERTGWIPQISLEQTVRETLDDWREKVNRGYR